MNDPLVEMNEFFKVKQRRNPNRAQCQARYKAKRQRKGTIRAMKSEFGRRLTDAEMMGV